MRKRILTIVLLCIACVFALSGCGYSRHKVKDKNPLETRVFLDKPDSMVVICGGEEKTLSSADLDEVYEEAFWEIMGCYEEYAVPLTGYHTSYARNKFVNDCKDKNTCVEFRYNRRRKFTGVIPSNRYDCEYFTGRQFDAMLLVCEENSIIALPYYKGKYDFISPCYLKFQAGVVGEIFTPQLESRFK